MDAATLAGFKFDLPLNRGKKKSESAPTSELSHVAARLYERADDVERNWSAFSNEEKEMYTTAVYKALEGKPSLIRQVRFRAKLLTAPTDAILQYRVAVWKFVNTVLDKVEEEDEGYRAEIANVLEEFKAGKGGIVVTQDNVLKRLREL